jgi:O-antigen/teichoic acid export membrane protein
LKFIKKAVNNQFLRNVSSLAIGTIISQIVVILASPLLTRFYSVEAFGLLSLFTSCMVIFGVFTTGRYEFALGLPEKDDKAKIIFRLITLIGSITSIVCLFIVFILREIVDYKGLSGLFETRWIYLAPIYSFCISLYSGLLYWNQRGKYYKRITIANALQVITTTIFSLIFGFFFFFEEGMLLSLVIGVIASSVFLLRKFSFQDISFNEIKKIAIEYISFPKYMILSDLSLTISQQFVPIIFSSLYTTTIVGFYSLANRMIRLPNIIITSSIASVFRNEAIDEIRIKGNCKELYISTLKKLILISVPIYLFVFFSSPFLFSLFFGEKWIVAGKIARILSIVLMFEFIVIPLNSLFYIKNKQKIYLRIQFLNMIFGIMALFSGFYYFNNFYYSIIFFSTTNLIFYSILFNFSYKYSK